jgi:hypothetical protein
MIRLPGDHRLLILSFASALVLSMLACSLSFPGFPGSSDPPDETELALSVEATLTYVIATEQAALTEMGIAAPSATPTAPHTATQVPSDTPVPTSTATPSPAGLYIGPITLARDADDDNLPVDPGEVFERGLPRIYATFAYSGLEPGMQVKFYWELDGKEWFTSVITWEAPSAGNYARFIHYEDESALDAGRWAVKVYVDGELLQTGRWVIE